MSSVTPPTTRRFFHDWTRDHLPPEVVLTPFQQFIRSRDWSSSPVGPMKDWCNTLRQMVLLIERDTVPCALYWGEEQTIIYNEAYTLLVGQKHPGLMGQDPHIGLAEVWPMFSEIMKKGVETGKTLVGEKQMLHLSRYGYLEETYYDYRFIPIVGDDGYVVGHYGNPVDVTREVLNDRRAASAHNISSEISACKSMQEFWPSLLAGFGPTDKDFPLIALYATSQHASEPSCSQSERMTCLLEGCLGVSESQLPSRLIIPREDRGVSSTTANIESLLATLFQQSLNAPGPLLVTRGMLPDNFLKGITWRGFGTPSQEFLIIPLRTGKAIVIGFIFTGLNPMKRFRQDCDFEDHVKMITSQVAIPRASSILQAEEIRQGEEKLSLRSNELKQSEAKYRNFAEHAPIGVALVNSDRCMEFANEAWFQITDQSREDTSPRPWLRIVHDDDLDKFNTFFDDLLACKGLRTVETRLKKAWTFHNEEESSDLAQDTAWILASGYTEMNSDGTIGYFVVWITDISTQKAVERGLDARFKKALEMKRQQENFVDNICHEIRNPASAMLHCAEEISIYLQDCLKETAEKIDSSVATLQRPDPSQALEWLKASLDAAQTIVNCVNHQRSIVDDVLTLSKLDSNLLSISPVIVEPQIVVRDAVKLFEGEMRNASIKWTVHKAASVQDLGANWVLLDPGRIHQIIINLLTNAIKFTRNREQREINVRLSAVMSRPTMGGLGVEYFPVSKHRRRHSRIKLAANHGPEIYLIIAVTDTGKGLSEEEKSRLFERFVQSSPKTYTQYGGSGLGLWISREITEMMDGEIGVVSEEGVGSTFTFFIRTQIANPPLDQKSNLRLELSDPLSRSVSPHRGGPSPSNILVVEDNLVNQKVLCKALKNRGFNVLAANHGGEALNALYRTKAYWGPEDTILKWPPFDVILMDIEMPHMDGITCIRKIRALEAEGALQGHIATIAVSANARPDHVTAALNAGMDGFTTKPYRMDDLVVQMEKSFAKTRRKRSRIEGSGTISLSLTT